VEAGTVLEPGATLLLYTDGLVERRGENLDVGLGRLTSAAARLARTDPAALTRDLLAELLADAAQPDDVALLAARLLPGPLQQRMPADPSLLTVVRRTVGEWAAATGLSEEITEDLQLALGEAVANAVEHAYPAGASGECVWSVEADPDGGVRGCVEDFGAWRPPPEDRGHRGRGLELIAALARDVDVGRTPDGGGSGTTVRFRIPASPAPSLPTPRPSPDRERLDRASDDGVARLDVVDVAEGRRFLLAGALDLAAAGTLAEELRDRLAAVAVGETVTLDLSATDYLASAGVGLLLEAAGAARTRGVDLRVHVEPGSVAARVLALTGVGEALSGRGG
jgi:anti-anti-sigma factor